MRLLGNHLLVLDRTERRRVSIFALSLVFVAVSLSVGLSIYLARHQGLQSEKQRALSYARDALRRSEATFNETFDSFSRLQPIDGNDNCSTRHLGIMRQADIVSSHIQAVGRLKGSILQCSSLGAQLDGLDLGPVELEQSSGTRIRTHVYLPFAPGERFLALEHAGYVAIIHPESPIDASTEVKDVSFAITGGSTPFVLTSRGRLNEAWLRPISRGTHKQFVDDGYVVAVVSSSRHLLQAVSAVPAAQFHNRIAQYALTLIPVGLLMASVTGAAALYLARQRTSMQAVMNSAWRRNEFYLEYQPIVDLRTSQWIGAEALIRWRRPNNEIIGPDRFIPIAEENGLSQWISQRVVDLLESDAQFFFRDFPNFYLSINLTAADLHDTSTVCLMRKLIAATGARRGNLVVEATERFMTEVNVAKEVIRAVRAQGISVAIDDFGTGYSSLSYLETLEIDTLKIDKSFIDTLDRNIAAGNVALHIIEMAKSLNLTMVAEGVETPQQAEHLRDLGVQYAQGWLFSRPVSLELLKAQLKNNVMV